MFNFEINFVEFFAEGRAGSVVIEDSTESSPAGFETAGREG
jgi:hypothetical protein